MLNLSSSLSICSSLLLLMFLMWKVWQLPGAWRFKTLMSKKGVLLPLSPESMSLMFSLFSSCLFAVHSAMVSPERGCSPGWGTLLSGSLILLCLTKLNPPQLQVKACSTVKLLPHTPFSGSQSGFHPTSGRWHP